MKPKNLFPTALFGSIGYFQRISHFTQIEICIAETYQKQTCRNRYAIHTAQGIEWLTVPVKRIDGSKTITSRIEIDNTTNWQQKHWRAIESAYRSAPYFEFYDFEVKLLLFQPVVNLIEFNKRITLKIFELFDLEIEIVENITISEEIWDLEHQFNLYSSINYKTVFERQKDSDLNISVLDLLFCEGPIGRKLIFK